MEPYPDTPDEGSIMVGAELLPLSSPEFELGPPGQKAIELARVVDRGIRESKCIDFKKLCITEGEKAWTIVIDICTINDAGNLLDASSLAAIAALRNTTFPEYKDDKIDYKKKTSKKLELKDIPLSVTVIKIGDKFLVDPDSDEEKAIEILRKRGEAQAVKKSDREQREGSMFLERSGSKVALIHLACETDFVVRGEDFQNAGKTLAKTALTKGADAARTEAASLMPALVSKLGENITFVDAVVKEGAVVGTYVHSNAKIGVIVALDTGSEEVAKDVIQVAEVKFCTIILKS